MSFVPANVCVCVSAVFPAAWPWLRAVVETHRGPAAPFSLSHGHGHPHHLHGPASSLRAPSPGAPPSPLPPPKLPPLHVRVCGGQGTLTLRISDQGGGIPDDIIDKVGRRPGGCCQAARRSNHLFTTILRCHDCVWVFANQNDMS